MSTSTKEQKHAEYMRNKDRYIERAKKWARANPEKRKAIVNRNNAKFSERRKNWHQVKRYGAVIERVECEVCGEKNKADGKFLVVHHIDGNNGKMGKSLNNELSNLQVLCRRCHPKLHHNGVITGVLWS